ncbi:uncharacterized protein LOC117751873 isoform X2 [Hippoglossus hippoglossus]|uniref:uncharacterized protein LOC117751873 isoform X2 n=1 Tax=Hippoglossus hippoglossus TaxID=8267 RepID=UPI00148D62FF|nr:uncharacterized protein LOC117751873 isoform X2 [Hippoglossus hippoglossus]
MKRGSSVLQPPSDAAKRHTHPANTHTQTHTSGSVGGDARSLSVSNTHAERTQDTHAEGSSPFPAATSLFSPDVSTKMASDLLIKLSEATQKAQVPPGILMEAEPQRREALLEVRGGQQDEPGLALSPDGPGASPEPPSLTHTPDGNATTDTLASDMLRKLAERQEVNCHDVRIKEEEEPMEVDTRAVSDLIRDRPGTQEISSSSLKMANHHLVIKSEDQGLHRNEHHESKMSEQCLLGLKMEDSFFTDGSGSKTGDGVKMEDQFLFKAKLAERPFSSAKFLSGVKMEDEFYSGVKMENQLLSEAEVMDPVFSRAKAEEQLFFGAKMEDQCLRAVLWQDMSVNLASTLLHQLSERVSKSNSQPVERSTPPIRSSPVLKLNGDPLRSPSLVRKQELPHETQTSLSRDPTAGTSTGVMCAGLRWRGVSFSRVT